jgi:TrmH family RNA methyltransferase
MLQITSRQNAIFKHIRDLIENKRYRLSANQFWIDGANFTYKAIQNGWKIDKLIYVEEELESDFRKEVVNLVPEEKKVSFSHELYEVLASKKDIQGIGAIVNMQFQKNELNLGFGIVLENISNPGNLGMIIRACAAFNIQNIYIINPAVDPFNPETVRSSMESIFYVKVSIFDSLNNMKSALQSSSFTNIGTSLQPDSIDLKEFGQNFDLTENVLIWFGNEAKGLTDESKAICDKLLNIKMSENVDSLNIAGSASIFLYELLKV